MLLIVLDDCRMTFPTRPGGLVTWRRGAKIELLKRNLSGERGIRCVRLSAGD